MALVFLNGGAPSYTGFQFTSTLGLLTQIQTTLVSAGWILEGTSATNRFMKGLSIVGAHPCYIDFVVSGTSPNLVLTLRAWQDLGKTIGSPNSIHTHTFTDALINRLWLTADDDSGCICIFNSNGACVGHHFGFLNRYEPSDPWAWMIGRIWASGYLYAYVAKSKFNNTNWKQLSTDYSEYIVDPPIGVNGQVNNNFSIPLSTFDKLCRGTSFNAVGDTNQTHLNNANNAFYLPFNGRLNYGGTCVIDPYTYTEGRGSAGVYGVSNNPFVLFERGLIKYAFCGVSSLFAGQYATDSITGNKVLSTGGLQAQGMRIE